MPQPSAVLEDARPETTSRVGQLYQQILGRDPSSRELALSTRFLEDRDTSEDATVAWQQLAQVLLLSNEFLFLD